MPTHRRCSIKRLFLLWCTFCMGIAGCQGGVQKEAFTVRMWIEDVVSEAGIQGDDPFAAAESWHLLPVGCDPDEPLTRETGAYIAAHLYGDIPEDTVPVNGEECAWPLEAGFVTEKGWMTRKEDGKFHPRDILDRQEAGQILQKAVQEINIRTFDESDTEITWKNKEPFVLEEGELTEGRLTAECTRSTFESGDLVTDGSRLYKVIRTEGSTLVLQEADFEEETDDYRLEGDAELDLNQAEIVLPDENTVPSLTAGNALPLLHPYQRSFTVDGFQVRISAGQQRISADVTKKLKYGSTVYASLTLSGIHASYSWKKDAASGSYFRIQCSTAERAGIKNSLGKDLYGDFSGADRNDLIRTMTNLFRERKDAAETTLTLCTVILPLPGAPGASLNLSLELHLSVSGRVELTLTQKHVLGFEVRGGAVRLIKETDRNANAAVRADLSLLAGIRFALALYRKELMDLLVRTGAKGSFLTTVHRMDKDGHVQSTQAEVSPDFAEAFSEAYPELKICEDLKAYWILNVRLNSTRTAAGKLGLSAYFDILNEDNAPLLKGLSMHMEHFQTVAQCTVKDGTFLKRMDPVPSGDAIVLQEYSLTVKEGGTARIVVTGVPEGTDGRNLRFSCSSPYAEVTPDGTVRGVKRGAASVRVSAADGSAEAYCHVLVTE